ncbi:TA2R9 protein, partial [Alopecoenas beccarii]|nr:TA2R9 protein [Alopecoenas beccarii]
SQNEFNVTSYDKMSILVITLQAFAGMWINGFIVSVLCIAWVKKKSVNSNEKILLFLGCCRFLYLCIAWVYSFLQAIYSSCYQVLQIPRILTAIQSFFNFSNIWVSACLCVFYCIKIANFRHVFFTYLKAKIDRIVPWLLLVSVLLSLVVGTLVYDVAQEVQFGNFNFTSLGNLWKLSIRVDEHFFPIFFTAGLGFAIAFMAVFFSAFLLLFSLWRHKLKMQTNSMKNHSADVHIKAIKYILYFFFLYTINFTCLILALVYATMEANPLMFLVSVVQYAFPGVHSLILIFSNPKLEKTLLRALLCARCKACKK